MTDTTQDARTLVVERAFAHPPEKVWRAISRPHFIAEWLMPNDFEPRLGHRFAFRAEPQPGWDGIVSSEVLVIEPERVLAYRWDARLGELSMETVVTLTLTPTATGTLLRMEQSGFRPDQQRNYQGARYGWTNFLGKLDALLARIDEEGAGA